MIIFKILLAVSILLEFVFVPWFLKAAWPQRNKKSLVLKMVCSTLFVCAGLLALKISGNRSEFAKLIFFGLVMGWLGDFFLHVSNKAICFLIGLISFLGGHICYIWAYCWAITDKFPEARFFSSVEIGVFVIVFGVSVGYALKEKMNFGGAAIPTFIYTATLITMLVKAGSLGLRMVFASLPNAALICIMLIVGAFFFVVSDFLLAIIKFNGQKKNRPLKIVNIVTYFTAQILLACTILMIF